ncbi:hypothetical protein K450DRAFT_228203 [Umbelopsis ramanniana AG]|uniref:SWIRM domain-containing protein n=1 Tax=Umbelopsis ramanniana AG TaxID=1314678 RepID=A0AAD5EF36_UMBRA|nr:uncharacterized protein K450DRAFT_228203 [Umbelopsis ramanniana AG]KAI8582279.1 hypothetical protein K450DRAFT_228203 [Umbelopsis ramanniana AG]
MLSTSEHSLQCDSATATTTTSLLSPPLTPTSDNQSMPEDRLPWSVDKKGMKVHDHYNAMSPPDFYARKGRNKSLIRYEQAMALPEFDLPAPEHELIQCDQFITQRSFQQPAAPWMNHRKSTKPRRSLQSDQRADQKIFQLRVYDTSPSDLLEYSSRVIQPPVVKSKSESPDHYGTSSDDEQTIQFKRRRALSDASESAATKKCKTDAAMAFDRVNVEESDDQFFESGWIPNYQVFDQRPVRVVWKGSPLQIGHMPYFQKLHQGEVNIASTLRLTPEQYIKCKRTLIQAASKYESQGIPFRKSDAQKLCRVDVNKTSTLWSIFGKLGWMGDGCIN